MIIGLLTKKQSR